MENYDPIPSTSVRKKVIGMGAMNLDQIYQVERLITDGETHVENFRYAPGGSAANTIYALAKLGVNTGFIGAVGNDTEGKILIENLESIGVDTSHIKVKPKAKTGTALCLSDREGKRSIYVSPGANNLLHDADIDLFSNACADYINQAEFLHLSAFVQQQQFELQKRMLKKLDPAVQLSLAPGALYAARGFQQLSDMLQRTCVLFLNRTELRQLTGNDLPTGAEKCLKMGCQIVVITLGKGEPAENTLQTFSHNTYASEVPHYACFILHKGGELRVESRIPLQPNEIKEATGAGDAFAAGFLYGLLHRKDLHECGILGDLMGHFCLNGVGAREGIPTLDELSERIKNLSYP